jgi:transcriptional regulator with XRE-family HTH domain
MTLRMVDTWVVPVIDLTATGRNIKRLRQSAGISVRDLQMVLGFTNPQAIYKWQNGDCMPSIDNLVILAAVLGVTIDELIVVDGDSDGDGDNTGSGKADLNRSAFEKCLQQILVYDS